MSSGKEQVIELSVEETNKLRAQLGLAPLRGTSLQENKLAPVSKDGEQQVLELSVEETNNLRAELGLAPLRTSTEKSGKPQNIVHKPAENIAEVRAAAERIEQAKLKRAVQEGIEKFKQTGDDIEPDIRGSALSWAERMRGITHEAEKQTPTSSNQRSATGSRYDEEQLKGLTVAHSVAELVEGSTTILTLSDVPLLEVADDTSKKIVGLNEHAVHLENVNLAEERKRQVGLREKRKLEMGMGRAGGYAGFDDDEFEELGGSQVPMRLGRDENETTKAKSKVRGFQIGDHLNDQDEQMQLDLFATEQGKAVSLEVAQADVTASDFMTAAEEEALRQAKKKDKDAKFKKHKKKKKDKKDKRKRFDKESDDEDEDKDIVAKIAPKGLLDELEETAAVDTVSTRKRRRDEQTERTQDENQAHPINRELIDKRAKYDAVMERGNQRTNEAFRKSKIQTSVEDEEPDDAFLDAALDKARRLNRLKELASKRQIRGADAVVEAVKSANLMQERPVSGSITFSVDETREFTRALQTRTEQMQRSKKISETKSDKQEGAIKAIKEEFIDQAMEEDDLGELAKEVKEDPEQNAANTLDVTTATAVSIGRGVGNVLNLLKQSGEATLKNGGREEMRGRAKDKRTYEDYEPLNLSEVVNIDLESATEKDKELAQREVKLEYRDKHGRLLTRKEAFRDLCYQFHGYGSGKRKEEKKLEQISREQAEARLASRLATGAVGTFGALKATQKATGKAFVVHKTQT